MSITRRVIACALLCVVPTLARADSTDGKPKSEMLDLPIQVVDPDGQPIAGATVIPWALRCSQGHGGWRPKGFGDSEPPKLTTDSGGQAVVPFPRYAVADERVLTLEVTLSVDHPDFAYVDYEFIDIPRKETGPHKITLKRGASVKLTPMQDGKLAPLDGLYAVWSDGRSWKPDSKPAVTDDGALRIPTMRTGKGEILLVRLDGERATHFSPFVRLDLKEGDVVEERVDLKPAVRITGALSDNVPRPVRNGRLKAETLRTDADERVDWVTWAPIAEDGTFVIDAWPAAEAIQIIALSDGFIAESGKTPAGAKNPWEGKKDPFHRPQVFAADELSDRITLAMQPMGTCRIETVDQDGEPIAGADVRSNPNVGWWNGGSQIYCSPLVRGERLLTKRDYETAVDESYPQPFTAKTDAQGRATMELPFGKHHLGAGNDDYELPIAVGRRVQDVELTEDGANAVRLVLQPTGTEHLGEWDKLAGVLFGCTGEQCRRLLEDPEFRSKMDKVRGRLDAAKDPKDPKVLLSAFADMADAFDDLDDKQEAQKWRRKADEQAQKLTAPDAEDASK